MSLLTPTESVTARIASDAVVLAAHLRASIHAANSIVKQALDLPTDQLNEWLNARPLEQRMAEFTLHGATGEALNAAAAASESATGGGGGSLGRVDVRSVADKLFEQGRALEVIDGVFLVSDIPQPDPA